MKFEVTCHALERWSVRSSMPALDIRVAWLDAIELDESDVDADEVRYHVGSEACLVRKNDSIVTVLDADNVRPKTERAIAAAIGGESA
ncbi:hypothetical protein [Haloparvum sp. AD34]